jgi:hypothetical protein
MSGRSRFRNSCFRVSEPEFDAILGRIIAAGIPYRSLPHGPEDNLVNPAFGGRLVYWSEPDGHVWEVLTVRYPYPHPRISADDD